MTFALHVDPAIQTPVRLALGLLLLGSSWHKLRHGAHFHAALEQYRVLPSRSTRAAAAALTAAELCVGIALFAGVAPRLAALAAAALLGSYSAAIAVNLARGRRDIDCGCAGPGARRPLSEGLLARNAVLIFGAALCALPSGARPLVWVDALTVTAGVAALALLYAACDAALANGARLRAARNRA
ncbi:MAG: DoxX family membrane protein [Deltaproteobacteria bacterium]|nr:MAG: DoxX family membrane protein [Deltaproteobacteria bacterium]